MNLAGLPVQRPRCRFWGQAWGWRGVPPTPRADEGESSVCWGPFPEQKVDSAWPCRPHWEPGRAEGRPSTEGPGVRLPGATCRPAFLSRARQERAHPPRPPTPARLSRAAERTRGEGRAPCLTLAPALAVPFPWVGPVSLGHRGRPRGSPTVLTWGPGHSRVRGGGTPGVQGVRPWERGPHFRRAPGSEWALHCGTVTLGFLAGLHRSDETGPPRAPPRAPVGPGPAV